MDKELFISKAIAQLDKPYIWKAKGPDAFDCSGLVTYCMKQAGFNSWQILFSPIEITANAINKDNWEKWTNAQRLWDHLPEHEAPWAGDLAFYGPTKEKIDHVVICLDTGQVIGACGGNSSTHTAIPYARVKYKTSPEYRPDLRGYRSLPKEENND